MKIELGVAVAQLDQRIKSEHFVRAVLSGRRRNMQTEYERIDIKPVLIKEELKWQIISSDGKKDITKNVEIDFNFTQLFSSGYANLVVDTQTESYQVRISKKDEALVSVSKVNLSRDLSHDRQKQRMLAESNQVFKALDMSDLLGRIKPSKMDKYKQVDEFLRLISQTLDAELLKQDEISVVDLGCGHAYLTFAAHQYLRSIGMNVKVIGIDVRSASRDRNNEIAKKLGISKTINFLAEEISQTTLGTADVAIALHACDTATDDAISWAVTADAKLALIAPCCHHDIQAQMVDIPEPWQMMTRNGIMKERLGDLITDALRMQIMKLHGYRVEAIEFIGGEHTPRNLMIRAVKTGAIADSVEEQRYEQMLSLWKVKPALAALLSR